MTIVRDCMFRNIATLEPTTTLLEAIRRVLRQELGFAVVLDNLTPIGMVTEFDFIKWMVRGHRMETTLIQDLPIPTPHIVVEHTDCQEFLTIYNQRRFRRFPVMNEDGLLSGGIMEKQILAALPRSNLLSSYRVANMVVSTPPSVPPDTSFSDCAKRMVQWHRGCVLVTDQDRMLGIITEGDLLRQRIRGDWSPNLLASTFMTRVLVSIDPHENLLFAIEFFRRTGHRQLPVVSQDGRLIGLLTQTDLLKQMAQAGRSRQAVLNPEDVPEPALWFQPDGDQNILAFNEKARKYLDLNPDIWIGRPIRDLGQDPQVWPAIQVLLRNTGTLTDLQLPVLNGTGQGLTVQCRFSLVHTPSGKDRIFWAIEELDTTSSRCGAGGGFPSP
jgi:large subunit ribosomal protein L28